MAIGTHPLPADIMETCTDGFMYCFAKWTHDVTGGTFWVLALLSFCVVIYMASGRYGGVRAFAFASFVGLLGGIWLSILTLIPWWAGSTFIIVGAIGLAGMIISEKN